MPTQPCAAELGRLEQALAARVAAVPDQTLEQLRDWAKTAHGVHVGVTTMWKTLARLGLSLKKSLHATEQERPDVAQAR